MPYASRPDLYDVEYAFKDDATEAAALRGDRARASLATEYDPEGLIGRGL